MNDIQESPSPATQLAAPATDWMALALGLLLLTSALILVFMALLLIFLGWITPSIVQTGEGLALLKLAAGALMLAVLLTPGIYLNALKFFKRPEPRLSWRGLPAGLLVSLLFIAWIVSLLLGNGLGAYPRLNLFLLPFVNVAALILPVSIFLVICLRELPRSPARRTWSIFGANAILAPSLAFFFEIFALIGFGLSLLLYVSLTPGLDVTFWSLVGDMQNELNMPETISQQATALLLAPGTRILLFGLFALAVPLIEEIFKVALLWFYAGRMRSPVEGFVAGVLCGAAFALAENIGFTSSGAEEWLANTLVRASAILPHIFNSGLIGWALVGAWRQPGQGSRSGKHGYLRLGLAYLVAVLIHGAWNALSLMMAFTSSNEWGSDLPSLFKTPLPIMVAWGVLISGLLLGLFLANRQMRKQVSSETAQDVEYNSSLS